MTKYFEGVFPAITTPFNRDGSVDHGFLRAHARRQAATPLDLH